MAGVLGERKGKAALIALALGLLILSLAPTVAVRQGAQPPVAPPSKEVLRPDWVELSPAAAAPSPAATEAPPPTPTEPPVASPAPPEPLPTIEATPPAPTETIAIAGVLTPTDVPPSATVPPPPTAAATAPPAATTTASPVVSRAPPAAPAVSEGLDLPFAEAIVELTNEVRQAHGLSPLAEHPALVAAAQGYADLHAHVSPDHLDHGLNGSTLSSRAEAEGYAHWTFLAENLVWTSLELSPTETVQQWLNSPGHRGNLLNPDVNETGVGCYVSFAERPFRICVQEFGART